MKGTVNVLYPDGSTRKFFNVVRTSVCPITHGIELHFKVGESRVLVKGSQLSQEKDNIMYDHLVGGKSK